MPALANARYEAFCLHRVKGMAVDEAYEVAGFKPNRGNCSRLNRRPEVQARIKELQEKAAARTVTTVEDIARQLDEDRQFARHKDQASAAVSATMGKAKVLGLIVDKHLVGHKRIEDMTKAELQALLGVRDSNDDASG